MKSLFSILVFISLATSLFGATYYSYSDGGFNDALNWYTNPGDIEGSRVTLTDASRDNNRFYISHNIVDDAWNTYNSSRIYVLNGGVLSMNKSKSIQYAVINISFGGALNTAGSFGKSTWTIINNGFMNVTGSMGYATIENTGTITANSIEANDLDMTVNNSGILNLTDLGKAQNKTLTFNNEPGSTMNVTNGQTINGKTIEINNQGNLTFTSSFSMDNAGSSIYNYNGGNITVGGDLTLKAGTFESGRSPLGVKDAVSQINLGTNNLNLTNSAVMYNNGTLNTKAIAFSAGPTLRNDCDGYINVAGTGSVFNSNTKLYNGGEIDFRDSTTIQDAVVQNGTPGNGLTCEGTMNFYSSLTLLNDGCVTGGSINFMKPNLLHQNGSCDLSSNNVALPIELISFSGRKDGNKIRLNWTTASEKNNDYFTIEKLVSTDYTTIETVEGSGTTSLESQYSAYDNDPNLGINYYRLVQTDFNGEIHYYAPIAVNYSSEQAFIYPTVINDEGTVNVSISNTQNVYYQIVSENGSILTQGQFNEFIELPTESFQYGLNTLIIGDGVKANIIKQ